MKRIPIKKTARIRTIWPIFSWKRCSKCGMEVRREWIWCSTVKTEDYTAHNPAYNITEKYLCTHCAPSRIIAQVWFNPQTWFNQEDM